MLVHCIFYVLKESLNVCASTSWQASKWQFCNVVYHRLKIVLVHPMTSYFLSTQLRCSNSSMRAFLIIPTSYVVHLSGSFNLPPINSNEIKSVSFDNDQSTVELASNPVYRADGNVILWFLVTRRWRQAYNFKPTYISSISLNKSKLQLPFNLERYVLFCCCCWDSSQHSNDR